MNNLAVQFLGLVALLIAIGFGYWRWVRPHPVNFETRGVLIVIVLTMVGGLIGSTGWWFDSPSAFAWDLPPLASRMLAAAAWAFGIATFMTLQHPTSQRIRLVLLMLMVYMIPLAVAIFLFHRDRFDWTLPITYSFFIVVLILIVSALWYLYRRPVIIADDARKPLSQPIRWWLMIVAIITGLWGIALFVTDNGPVSLLWVWPGDLLTSRLISVMLLTIAVAALYSLRDQDLARVTLATLIVYGLGAALANLWSATAGKPMQPLYVAAFGLMGIVSLIWIRQS